MPELPEVEVIRRGLLPHLKGVKVIATRTGPKDLRLPIPREKLDRWITSAAITDLYRRGKYLLLMTDKKAAMIIHLGMTGNLVIFPAEAPPALHDHICFCLENGLELRYNDVRRFGCLQLLDPEELSKKNNFASLGPEPLATANPGWLEPAQPVFSGGYLKQKAGKRVQPIKNFLMDNRVVAGIGNIYANEILFLAGILPSTPIGSVSSGQWQKITAAAREILQKAIEMGGSTIRNYANSSGNQGYFQSNLMVYGREGKSCKICGTPIKKEIIAGRGTYLCPGCQI
ncbi:MAG: bifunctional DNA-formamidopyrimidine glycosylase/DNA-(apurinic or apyrimidinic site) lyase [Thermodesulfobacteriota bacterium]